MKIEFPGLIFEKPSNIKFHDISSIRNRVVPYGRTDGLTDMTKEVAFFFLIFKRAKSFAIPGVDVQMYSYREKHLNVECIVVNTHPLRSQGTFVLQ
jgi:hypothetical protein